MKPIKVISNIFSLSVILFGLSSCAGGKETGFSFDQEPPFTLGDVYYQDWVAGVRKGGSGTNIYITIDSYVDEVVIMDIYFRNKKLKAQNSYQNRDQYVGYLKNQPGPDIIMDIDPVKESQNIPPESFPFQLEEDEAVLSYLHNEEVKFLKISKMEQKPMIAYPGVNSKGID
jgi:hypothetical protein